MLTPRTVNSFQSNLRPNLARIAFWFLCLMAVGWVGFAAIFETRAGIPVTREEWGHRLIGWFIELMLLRTFVKGVRRYYQVTSM